MDLGEFKRLNPDYSEIKVPPLQKLKDGRIISTPEEAFVTTYLLQPGQNKTAQFMREEYWVLQNPDLYPRALFIDPRGFAKSTRVCVYDSLYDIYVRSDYDLCLELQKQYPFVPFQYDFCNRLYIITNSDDLSEQWVGEIKRNIQENEKLLAHFGDVSTESDKNGIWRSNHIHVKTKSGIMEIKAFGRGSTIRGGRPRKVKVDDILKDKDGVYSAEDSKKAEKWLKRSVEGLMDRQDCRLYWTATILAPEDMVDNAYEKRDDWSSYKMLRIKNSAEDVNGKSIWPDKFPDKFLRFKRDQMGVEGYYAEYMNKPIISKNAIFRREWMQNSYTDDELPNNLYRVLSIDPAMTTKEINDYTAFIINGYCYEGVHKGEIYTLDAEQGHWDNDSVARLACEKYRSFRCDVMVLEINAAQKVFGTLIRREARDHSMWINLEEKITDTDKVRRANSINFLYKNNYVRFRKDDPAQAELINALCIFPSGRHDDFVDADMMNLEFEKERHESMMSSVEEEEDDRQLACPELGY